MMEFYDVIVVGAGSGGLSFAKSACKFNKKVAIIDKGAIGGTCVNLGCVPKKITYNLCSMLVKSKKFLKSEQEVDFSRFVEMRDQYIKKLNKIYYDQLLSHGIVLIPGKAQIEKDNIVSVGNKKYKANQIVLCTGSKPKIPDIPGKEFLKTSDDFFALKKLPKKVIIIGSGYIAIETTFILLSLGVEVEIILRNNKFLSNYDEMIGNHIMELLKNKCVVHLLSNTVEISKIEDSYNVTIDTSGTRKILYADFVMCSTGRDCDTSFIKLPIKEKNGYLVVDGNFRTSIPNIYALGDLIGPKHMLTPVAIFCGKKLADYLYGKSVSEANNKINNLEEERNYENDVLEENKNDGTCISEKYRIFEYIPTVVFSHPPCASVGLSELEARRFGKVEIYESQFINLYYALFEAHEKEKSIVKVVVMDKMVVGIHMVGMGADEIIQGFAVALKHGITYEEFVNTICVHPTASEEIILVKKRE